MKKINHHKLWKERQAKEIKIAKEIYKRSKDFDSSIDLDKITVEIYDMLNEEDWHEFAPFMKKLEEEANLFSGGDEEDWYTTREQKIIKTKKKLSKK